VIAVPPDDPDERRLGQYVASLLRRLGYRAVIRVEEDPVFAMLGPGSDVNVIRLGWTQDYAAPSNFIEPLFTCTANENDGINVSGFCNRRLDALVARARGADDVATTSEVWSRVDHLLVDEAPAVPLYSLRQADLVSKRAGNYVFNPQFGVLLDQLWVE
jgi:ABC-type oligopeptide transport system substrate-binding subunit